MKRLLIMLSFITLLFAAKASITAEFPKKKLYIGDRIRVSYILPAGKTTKLLPPDAREWIRDFEIFTQSTGTVRKKSDSHSYTFEGAAFDTGFVYIPSMPLILQQEVEDTKIDTLYTPDKYLYIYSLLDSSATALPLQPPFAISALYCWEYFLSILLFVMAAFLLYYGLGKRKNRKRESTESWLPPREKAKLALAELQKKQYPQKEEWKAFYLDLTYIIREYYEAVFFVHLQELTSRELLLELEKHLETEDMPGIREFFQFADLVKFAKMPASEKRCDSDIHYIQRLIEENEARIHSLEEEADKDAGISFLEDVDEE